MLRGYTGLPDRLSWEWMEMTFPRLNRSGMPQAMQWWFVLKYAASQRELFSAEAAEGIPDRYFSFIKLDRKFPLGWNERKRAQVSEGQTTGEREGGKKSHSENRKSQHKIKVEVGRWICRSCGIFQTIQIVRQSEWTFGDYVKRLNGRMNGYRLYFSPKNYGEIVLKTIILLKPLDIF